ncbi:hypothetical protein PYW07_011774 [Mythimna separata]|uniref:BPTI/Kunitz inhibitor domain-containing protein n=1 Tax=Mythimna separata TaxID=271217 RepID=A0AAD7Y6T3_MYTSE|nr:hypothetical protein PYW07_011774 [Mythimna separata]
MKLFCFLVLFAAVVYAAINPICLEPTDPGRCMFRIPRYTYNSTTGRCERFTWRGCGGNSNNFVTMANCSETCES